MIVVVVIGIGTAMGASSIGEAFSDNRALRASRELVRIGRRAKAETMGYMRAHLVWIEPEAHRVSLIRGTGWRCTNEDWAARLAAGPCRQTGATATAVPCLEQVDFEEGNSGNDDAYWPSVAFVSGSPAAYNSTAAANTAICYEPSGAMYSDQGATLAGLTLSAENTQNGAYLFAVRRMSGAEQAGLSRWVMFPQGSPPRLLR